MKIKAFGLIFIFIMVVNPAVKAQSLTKEALNAFAHFTRTRDIGQLEIARKNIDETFKTAKDSLSAKNNLIRALVYSTLAAVDSNRELTYKNDPLADASRSFSFIKDNARINSDYAAEIDFIKNQLAWAYLYEAGNALSYSNFEDAEQAFAKVDSLSGGGEHIYHNLAILNERLGNPNKAILYYKKMIEIRPRPEYFFSLSDIYAVTGEGRAALKVLQEGRSLFPENRDLVYKEINYFADRQEYKSVIRLLPNALKIDEHIPALNYLAGFSYEMVGNFAKAEEFYEKVLNSDPNNFDANYALGLLYLNLYSKDPDKKQLMYTSLYHLSKANEIDQNQLKALQSLAILYEYKGDLIQLQRVNNKINQLKLN